MIIYYPGSNMTIIVFRKFPLCVFDFYTVALDLNRFRTHYYIIITYNIQCHCSDKNDFIIIVSSMRLTHIMMIHMSFYRSKQYNN